MGASFANGGHGAYFRPWSVGHSVTWLNVSHLYGKDLFYNKKPINIAYKNIYNETVLSFFSFFLGLGWGGVLKPKN